MECMTGFAARIAGKEGPAMPPVLVARRAEPMNRSDSRPGDRSFPSGVRAL